MENSEPNTNTAISSELNSTTGSTAPVDKPQKSPKGLVFLVLAALLGLGLGFGGTIGVSALATPLSNPSISALSALFVSDGLTANVKFASSELRDGEEISSYSVSSTEAYSKGIGTSSTSTVTSQGYYDTSTLTTDVVMDKDHVFYFRFNGLADLIKANYATILEVEEAEEIKEVEETEETEPYNSNDVISAFSDYDNKWLKLSIPALINGLIDDEDLNSKLQALYSCVTASADSANELAPVLNAAYKKYPFINLEKYQGSLKTDLSGTPHIPSLDKDKFKSFYQEILPALVGKYNDFVDCGLQAMPSWEEDHFLEKADPADETFQLSDKELQNFADYFSGDDAPEILVFLDKSLFSAKLTGLYVVYKDERQGYQDYSFSEDATSVYQSPTYTTTAEATITLDYAKPSISIPTDAEDISQPLADFLKTSILSLFLSDL